jgi:anthranilate synthase component 1
VTPHVRELLADTLTPLSVYRRLRSRSPVRFLFESVTGGEQVSRYSFLGAGPREILRLYPDRLERQEAGLTSVEEGRPLAALRRLVDRYRCAGSEVPFIGGYVGYAGFDLVRQVEDLPDPRERRDSLPVAVYGRFDSVVVFDHAHQRVLLVANEIEGEVDRAQAEAELSHLQRILTEENDSGGAVALPSEAPESVPLSEVSIGGADFRAAVERAREYILAGDIFQVVLARRFTVESQAEPLALYRALRLINPSPYMVLLELPEVALVGASPEMLVRKTGRRLEIRPIAGTRRRGANSEEDRRLATELLSDAKERAEHLMLVDLGRNDLGRVAKPATVEVSSFMEVERYSHVMHIVSSVGAELSAECDAIDALLACFPAGTVSGAPKVRALQIIDELEPEPRGPYAGAVGYLSYTGDLDTCIGIRTLVVENGRTSVTAGAGIVADSDPWSEELETENKAAALLAAVALADRLGDVVGEREREP